MQTVRPLEDFLTDDEISFSLCRFSKYSGVVETVTSWNATWSCAVTGSVAALNPVERLFFLIVYNEETGEEFVAAVDVGQSNILEHVTHITETEMRMPKAIRDPIGHRLPRIVFRGREEIAGTCCTHGTSESCEYGAVG